MPNAKQFLSGHGAAEKNRPLLWLLLILLLFSLIYLPSLSYEFLNFDDDVYLTNNPLVTDFDLATIPRIFSADHTALFSPLVILSFALEYQIWGPNPSGYRLVNFLFHAGSILLLFWLCMRLFATLYRAVPIVFLFALHPLRIESLVWVTERKDVLFVFFVLLTLNLYLSYLRQKNNRYFVLALLALSLGMLAKVSAFAAFPLLFLLDWWEGRPFKRVVLLDKIPFLLVILLLGITGMGFLSTARYGINQGLGRMAMNALGIPLFMVSRFFWPSHLAVRYPLPIEELLRPLWLFTVLGLLFFLLSGHFCRWSRVWRWGAFFFFLTSLPILGVMWRMYPMADRYSYLPSIGLGVMVVEALLKITEGIKRPVVALAIRLATMLGFASVLLSAAVSYLPVWRNSLSLWNHVIRQYPQVELAYNNRGLVFQEQERYREALRDYDKALALFPDYADAYWNRGYCLEKQQQFTQADESFYNAIFREPRRFETLVYHVGRGQIEQGFRRALQLGTRLEMQGRRADGPFFYLMAFLNARETRWSAAKRYIDAALLQDPGNTVYLDLQTRITSEAL